MLMRVQTAFLLSSTLGIPIVFFNMKNMRKGTEKAIAPQDCYAGKLSNKGMLRLWREDFQRQCTPKLRRSNAQKTAPTTSSSLNLSNSTAE